MKSEFPPKNFKNLISLLYNLGFNDVGAGKHNYKFIHPNKSPEKDSNQPPFIIISTNVGPFYVKMIIQQIKKFGFTDDEIKKGCSKKIN